MSLSFFIANRLPLHAAKRDSSTGIFIAIAGIALSVIVMLISVAVMTGFRSEIRQKVIGFDSQISIGITPVADSETSGLISLGDIAPLKDILPPNVTYTLSGRQPAILKTPDNFSGSVIKGVCPDYDWSFIRANLVEGAVPDYTADSTLYHIVISKTLAQALSLQLGQKADTYFLGDGAYRIRRLKIAGIYDTHFSEYDRNMIFGSLAMLQQVANVPDTCATMVEINGLRDDEAIDKAEQDITATYLDQLYTGQTQEHYTVLNIHKTAALFFNWLALLDTNVTVILTLMSLLTLLTLVSSLFILILRRVNMIGILKALGASNRQIRTIFIIMSVRILVWGLLIGNLVGIGLLYIQHYTGIVPLNPDAYYLDHVPVEIQWPAIIALNIGITLLSLLVLLLPSAIITTIPPSKAIRYE